MITVSRERQYNFEMSDEEIAVCKSGKRTRSPFQGALADNAEHGVADAAGGKLLPRPQLSPP